MFQILVVEDNDSARCLMCEMLKENGFEALSAADGVEAMELLDHKHVDLVVLDVMMPRMDGYAFTKELRAAGSMLPILMVTAKEAMEDKWMGFTSGTDDYMVKPVDEKELILRIGALLRRSQIVSARRLAVGKVELNYDTFTVSREEACTTLPKKEFLLLYKLLSFPGKIFTKRQLMDEIWDMDSFSDEHTIEVHIGRLRERFKTYSEFEIVTVRGLGYKAVKKV